MNGIPSSSRSGPLLPASDPAGEAVNTSYGDKTKATQLDINSWCPNTVAQIRKRFTESTANFLFSLPRLKAALGDHSQCSTKRCIANNTQDDGYQSSHWNKCAGNCTFNGPDAQKIVDIIQSDGIPLISLRRAASGTLIVEVVRASINSRYFAVSHVWSGGLGNPEANALPYCQLTRLFDLWPGFNDRMATRRKNEAKDRVPSLLYSLGRGWSEFFSLPTNVREFLLLPRKLSWVLMLALLVCLEFVEYYAVIILIWIEETWNIARAPESLFWIDTLCIPVGSESLHKKLRSRAINTMAQIYVNAGSIVVLDHELQQLQFTQLGTPAILGYLLCSAWMSRCWTFQEGAMAEDWLVQFDDGLCSVDSLLRKGGYDGTNTTPESEGIFESEKELGEFYAQLPRLRVIHEHHTFTSSSSSARARLLLQVWNNLCSRSTTKREDLDSIITTMLDFRPSEVQALNHDQRLFCIFNSQEALPISLLYRERGLVSSWIHANRSLPSTIEESPVDEDVGIMWRRSPNENFFVFELSKSGFLMEYSEESQLPPEPPLFYFSHSRILSGDTLILEDSYRGLTMVARLKLSPNIRLSPLELCVIIASTSKPARNIPGACLGIREKNDEFYRCF
ncbi:hypothetical protein L207DRAFT_131709 [Hyaloscypha variabilis F]|uniref:Heterokaryon incompatibility domain-containing protein n=1 Tax=Hyaloscypha variabilis (strain UAMH 11265 / GT02V1 / F) TaxID=1149755 RepID=A0A2J6R9A4_HYAVF|nr:hypothetical protein L207DRAFT_131709 [Hyaloscypha variabilis F]